MEMVQLWQEIKIGKSLSGSCKY